MTDTEKEDQRIAFHSYCEKCGVDAQDQRRAGHYCKDDGGEFRMAWPAWCRYCWSALPEYQRRFTLTSDYTLWFNGWLYSGDKFCRNCGKAAAEVAMKGVPSLQPEKTTMPKRSFFFRLFHR